MKIKLQKQTEFKRLAEEWNLLKRQARLIIIKNAKDGNTASN